jgi:multidrug resistance efflux pump
VTEDRELRALVERLQVENRALQGENRALRDELGTVDLVEQQLAELEAELVDARRQLDVIEHASEAPGAQLAELPVEDLVVLVRTLQSQNAVLKRELVQANEELDAKDREALRARRELDIAREEQNRLRRLLDQTRLDLRAEIRKLRK